MEIRGLKARGYARTPFSIAKDAQGQWHPVRVPRGGLILDADDKPIGYHWPRVVDLRRAAAS
ncbi:hypothetical protein DM806_12810 [Sphingobium lactosutens]|nr:hypothetical protein [Sphingobium lactosutens]